MVQGGYRTSKKVLSQSGTLLYAGISIEVQKYHSAGTLEPWFKDAVPATLWG